MRDMSIIIGGVVLPPFTDFEEITEGNETDSRTLGGYLYTDWKNSLRSWKVSWKTMTQSDYDIVNALWLAQYSNGYYHTLQIDAESILVPVKIDRSNRKIKYNGVVIEDFFIILSEQYPFS